VSDRHTRDHIHTIVRTPNGNDYGKDLLRQHLLAEHGGKYGRRSRPSRSSLKYQASEGWLGGRDSLPFATSRGEMNVEPKAGCECD
jgi:hypothetical protein